MDSVVLSVIDLLKIFPYIVGIVPLYCTTVVQGTPTNHLANELDMDPKHLLERRRKIQERAVENLPMEPLPDSVVEADECFQNAGEKGVKHEDPDDPPCKRANKVRGHGTWDTDRPPIQGVVGRESGQVRFKVLHNCAWNDLGPLLMASTLPGIIVNTDSWAAYNQLSQNNRLHVTVCHSKKEWARDDDGDGIYEVHNNTQEGLWTGLRNFLRPFHGVSKRVP